MTLQYLLMYTLISGSEEISGNNFRGSYKPKLLFDGVLKIKKSSGKEVAVESKSVISKDVLLKLGVYFGNVLEIKWVT